MNAKLDVEEHRLGEYADDCPPTPEQYQSDPEYFRENLPRTTPLVDIPYARKIETFRKAWGLHAERPDYPLTNSLNQSMSEFRKYALEADTIAAPRRMKDIRDLEGIILGVDWSGDDHDSCGGGGFGHHVMEGLTVRVACNYGECGRNSLYPVRKV